MTFNKKLLFVLGPLSLSTFLFLNVTQTPGEVAGTKLTCDFDGLAIPEVQTYTQFPYGKSVNATVGFASEFGQIGASFYLHNSSQNATWWEGINILDGRSAGGAGWQTSYIGQTEFTNQENNVYVFNQAAGNLMQQWGYSSTFERTYTPNDPSGVKTRFSHKEWLPMYTDHLHPVNGVIPDFAQEMPTGPCNKSAKKFFNGKLEVTSTGQAVVGDKTNRNWPSSHVIEIKNAYQLNPTVTQDWRYFKAEQAMYLNKWTAAKNNLRIYLIGDKGDWVRGPIYPHWDKHWMPKLKDDPLAQSGAPVVCGDWLENNRCSTTMTGIAAAIFVWNHKGEDIGFSIHRSNYRSYFADLARSVSLRCDAPKLLDKDGKASMADLETYHMCGNLEWHSYLVGAQGLGRIPKTTTLNQVEKFEMVYSLGTFRELIQLTEDKLKTLRIEVDPKSGVMRKEVRK